MDNPQAAVSSPGFEGAEKLLEIWFQPPTTPVAPGERRGLFTVPRETWVEMLKLVRCEIIGYISSGELDAYLLSESSMFVGEHSLVLKTCGTTTPLLAFAKILEIAKNSGLTELDQFFYSRKTFMFPEFQKFPHTGWDDEVKFIEREGKIANGSAYVVGKTNGSHWYCYIWDLGRTLKKETRAPEKRPWSSRDYTIEVLMCGLDGENAKIFTKDHPKDENGRYKVTNALQALYDHVQIDDFMFDPCGYSCNGVSGHHYFDVHVTPESHCSFASFETNLPPTEKMSYTKLVSDVIAIFKPSEFTVTLFAEKDEFDDEVTDYPMPASFLAGKDNLRRQDRINYEFDHYDLAFTHYTTK